MPLQPHYKQLPYAYSQSNKLYQQTAGVKTTAIVGDPSPPHKAYVATRNTVLPFPAELSVTERGGIPYGASERMEEVR